jgi:thioredoxin-related protein
MRTFLFFFFMFAGVEKKNDDCRKIHHQRSNKWDAPKDALLVLYRQEQLSYCERAPRVYTKRKPDYWEQSIKEKRAKQMLKVQDEKRMQTDHHN